MTGARAPNPGHQPAPRRRPLRSVLSAVIVGLAVLALLVGVTIFVMARVDGPGDTPPANFVTPTTTGSPQ